MRLGYRAEKRFWLVMAYAILILMAIIVLFPFLWALRTSIMTEQAVLRWPLRYLPQNITFENYAYVWQNIKYPRWFLNSVIVASVTAIVSVIIASLAGYAFARFKFPLHKVMLLSILTMNMIPRVLLSIPYYDMMFKLKWLDTYHGLIIPYVAICLPFATWMLAAYFRSIPRDLDECAMVDGATRLQALFRVIIPLAGPGIVATGVYCFIVAWCEFLLSLTLNSAEEMRTLPVALSTFLTEFSVNWGLLSAAAVISTIPVVIMFSYLQKHLIAGLTAGAVKG
jgi:multiple sugar transport system permease protein